MRAYSDAFLGGHAKEAWQMRTPEAQAGDSYAEFAIAVKAAKEIYGDAEMTSLTVTVPTPTVGFLPTATATYTYDISEIDQTNQVWFKRDGKWLVNN